MNQHSVTINMDIEQAKQDTFCCGPFRTHVEYGATVVSILGIMFALLNALFAILPAGRLHDQPHPLLAVLSLVYVILFGFVILAQRKRNLKYFRPYLYVAALDIALTAGFAFVTLIHAITAPDHLVLDFSGIFDGPELKDPKRAYQMATTVEFLVMVAEIGIEIYFYSIIYRAFKNMRSQSFPGLVRLSDCV